jgi:hypothetical protein
MKIVETWELALRKIMELGLLELQPPPGAVFPWLKARARRGVGHRYKCPRVTHRTNI